MKYPKFIKKNETIGIFAPSSGVGHKLDYYLKALSTLKNSSFTIYETKSVRVNGLVSASGKQRASELSELINSDISLIMCATGGEFGMEMLPYVDFEEIRNNSKWIMGASDPTSLLFIITTYLDIATLYGLNASGFDQVKMHECLCNSLEIVQGNIVEQKSFDLFESSRKNRIDDYCLDSKVYWDCNIDKLKLNGRLIGGCLDVLKDLIGTKFDYTKKFVEKYKDDGIVWYFDIFSLSSEDVYRTLFQMKMAGWLENCKGVIVGRVTYPNSNIEMQYEDSFYRVFDDIPIIFNADIGHVAPTMTFINGALVEIECSKGKGLVRFLLA